MTTIYDAMRKLYAGVRSLPVVEPKVFKAWHIGVKPGSEAGYFKAPFSAHLIVPKTRGHKKRVEMFDKFILPLYDQLEQVAEEANLIQGNTGDVTPTVVKYSNHFFRTRIQVKTLEGASLDVWAPLFSTFTGRKWCFNGNRIRARLETI